MRKPLLERLQEFNSTVVPDQFLDLAEHGIDDDKVAHLYIIGGSDIPLCGGSNKTMHSHQQCGFLFTGAETQCNCGARVCSFCALLAPAQRFYL